MKRFDLVIVGGGASGIMAALEFKQQAPDLSVAIVEGSFAVGRKILVSGAGRCNITNVNLKTGRWHKYYYSDTPQILDQIFVQFGYKDILHFLNELGIIVYEEQKNNTGKIFPITDSAKNVVQILQEELSRKGVEVLLNNKCRAIRKTGAIFEIELESELARSLVYAKSLILAAGGKTYPGLGTDGSGFDLAQKLGHSIVEPLPVAGPVNATDPICKILQGVRAPALVKLTREGKILAEVKDEILFTSYGISGTAIFKISRHIAHEEARGQKLKLILDFLPALSSGELEKYFDKLTRSAPNRSIVTALLGLVQQKIAKALLNKLNLNYELALEKLSDNNRRDLFELLKRFELKPAGMRGWNESEFTAGGVRASEVDSDSLESRIIPGLFLCGEILNVDGEIGGFNLSWAWASGAVAGKSAVSYLLKNQKRV